MTQNHDARARFIFLGQKVAPEHRLDPENGKEIARDLAAVETFRLAGSREVKAFLGERCHPFEHRVLFAPIEEIRG
jgi:hypothetical protein